MAKSVRQGEGDQFDYWNSWQAYIQEYDIKPVSTGVQAVAERMREAGLTEEQARKELAEEYYAQREEAQKYGRTLQARKDQEALVRNNELDSACAVYQKADRILTGKPINVFLNDVDEPTPAWNDGVNITFNVNAIKTLTENHLLAHHGLNYHELAHLFYTPRIGSALGKWVMENKTVKNEHVRPTVAVDESGELVYGTETYYTEQTELVDNRRQTAFNILEDSRAEYYLITKFPSARPFLVATIGDYIASNADDIVNNFMLLVGRKYFDLDVRIMSAQGYARVYGEDNAKAIYNVVAEYRTLVFPRQFDRAKELITKLVNLLPEDYQPTSPKHRDGKGNQSSLGPTGCSGRPLMRNGKVESEKAQNDLMDSADKTDQLGEAIDVGKGADNNTGNAQNPNWETVEAELTEKINQLVEQAKQDPAVKRKVVDTIKAINKDTSTKSMLGKATAESVEPTAQDITASRLFAQELERIRIDSDPAWELERPTGKLNVRRAINADINDIGRLFDRWTTGNDNHEIEATVLLDRSGSMSHSIGAVCRSAWIIKRAIEKISGRVSVLSFSDVSRVLYSADEKAGATAKVVNANGGTDPFYSLKESERVLTQSKAKTKLLFLLTDGGFSEAGNDDIIQRLQREGVYVVVVFLSYPQWLEQILSDPKAVEKYGHGADLFRAIGDPLDLVKIAKSVVKAMAGNKNRAVA
jgi:hypothetical protein